MSRTEVFLKYAEEHPGEVFEILERQATQKIRELERKHAEARRHAPLPVRAPRRKYTAAELAEVPF